MDGSPIKAEASAAIHAVRLKRLQEAMQAVDAALAEGRAVSAKLLEVSFLLERGIHPQRIKTTFADLPRLLETARALESQQLEIQASDPKMSSRHTPV